MAIELMKAVLTDARFSDPDWVFERKLDGIRCVATKVRGEVDLRSRNDLSLNGRFPSVVEALAKTPPPTSSSTGRWWPSTATRRASPSCSRETARPCSSTSSTSCAPTGRT